MEAENQQPMSTEAYDNSKEQTDTQVEQAQLAHENGANQAQPPQPAPDTVQKLLGFKSSSLPQPEPLRQYLSQLLTSDPYNKFCVDCHHAQSTHACLTYGIFVCGACANIHAIAFGGRSKSQVKEVFSEMWDDYQLEAIAPGVGGNKAFYQYLQEYQDLAQTPIEKKYKSDAVIWYMRKLAAHIDQRVFNERQPAKDWDERLDRAKSTMKHLIEKVKTSTESIAARKSSAPLADGTNSNQIPEESKEAAQPSSEGHTSQEPSKAKEWSNKIKGFFKKVVSKESAARGGSDSSGQVHSVSTTESESSVSQPETKVEEPASITESNQISEQPIQETPQHVEKIEGQ